MDLLAAVRCGLAAEELAAPLVRRLHKILAHHSHRRL
jgi:hypothetical protein